MVKSNLINIALICLVIVFSILTASKDEPVTDDIYREFVPSVTCGSYIGARPPINDKNLKRRCIKAAKGIKKNFNCKQCHITRFSANQVTAFYEFVDSILDPVNISQGFYFATTRERYLAAKLAGELVGRHDWPSVTQSHTKPKQVPQFKEDAETFAKCLKKLSNFSKAKIPMVEFSEGYGHQCRNRTLQKERIRGIYHP